MGEAQKEALDTEDVPPSLLSETKWWEGRSEGARATHSCGEALGAPVPQLLGEESRIPEMARGPKISVGLSAWQEWIKHEGVVLVWWEHCVSFLSGEVKASVPQR